MDDSSTAGTRMRVTQHIRGGVAVVEIDGSLDSQTAPRLRVDLETLIAEQNRILLDLNRMSYMSSAGLRVLLLVYRQARQTGGRLALAGMAEEVHAIMAATGFLGFFAVADTVEDGIEALSS